MRNKTSNKSKQRSVSHGNPTVYRGAPPERVPKAPDHRGHTYNVGKQGKGTCSHEPCGVEVTLRKVTYSSPSRYDDMPVDSLVAASHREGGGQYSVRRGDVLCPGAGMPALPLPETEE